MNEREKRALDRIVAARGMLREGLARWMGDSAAADEVMQLAYLRALEYAGSIRSEEAALSWFQRLLRNAAVDYLRHEAAERRARGNWAQGEATTLSLPDDAAQTLCQCMAEVLTNLRPGYRQVIEQADLQERPIADIADELGATPNNVRVRLHRARTALKQVLLDTCGLCAEHGCLDCWCHRPAPPPSAGR